VAALTDGVLKAMFTTKLKTVAVVLVAAALVTTGIGAVARPALQASPTDQSDSVGFRSSDEVLKPSPTPRSDKQPEKPNGDPMKKKADMNDGVIQVEVTAEMLVAAGGKLPNLTWSAYIIVDSKPLPL